MEKKLKTKIIIIVAIALIAGLAGFAYGKVVRHQESITPVLCAQCHQMEQKVAGWKSSGHSKVSCVKCHTSVPYEALLFKPSPVREGGIVRLSVPVSNEICLTCHNPVNEAKMPGDLVDSHQAHIDKSLDCTDCHRWTGHSQPGTSTPGPFKVEGGPSMVKCIACHNGVKAPNACTTCHGEKKAPEDHKQKKWDFQHGANLTAIADSCNKCHGYDTKQEKKGSFKDFDLAAKNNSVILEKVNCAQCHSPGHQANWEKEHIPTVKAQGPVKCTTCHSLEGCNSCHRAKAGK